MDGLFKGRHFDQEIIVLCVRWYLRYKLSFRDLAERGLSLAHTTIMRWTQCYVPEFEKRWNRLARPAGRSWRVEPTTAVATQRSSQPAHGLIQVQRSANAKRRHFSARGQFRGFSTSGNGRELFHIGR